MSAPLAQSSVPHLPTRPSVPSHGPDSEKNPDENQIPVAILKLLEAGLGHSVSFGNKPLTEKAVETRLASAKPPAKSLNSFIVRYGNGKAPPTRNVAKAKLVASIVKELKF